MSTTREFDAIFKAYDVRGVVPDELDSRRAKAIGRAFAQFVRTRDGGPRIVVGRDMRTSGAELGAALIAGITAIGVNVVDVGLASTDLVYFASGFLDAPAVMLTASHNPAQYNGMKFCLAGARPIGEESGLTEIRDLAEAALLATSNADHRGSVTEHDLLDAFASHVCSFVEVPALAPLHVVGDAANGMGGLIAPAVFSRLNMTFDLLYGELDGTFPNHPADPLQEENLRDLRERLLTLGADIGLAFDGDADRVFLIDDRGQPVSGSTTTAIVSKMMLERFPGATILYNCICSRSVREVIEENGGHGVRTRVGHSFIKAVMGETGAVFGGEHSGHYYFRDNYRADSGIIAALVVLEVLSRAKVPLSELRKPFERYVASGEINTRVPDTAAVLSSVKKHYRATEGRLDELDGLTVEFDAWWFNLRPSNTEPLLRLNVEAADRDACAARVTEVQSLMAAASGEGG